jgi:hypothetical protein
LGFFEKIYHLATLLQSYKAITFRGKKMFVKSTAENAARFFIVSKTRLLRNTGRT